MAIESGFYAIKGDDGTTYDPINMNVAFQSDGLRVRTAVVIRNDLTGTHMVGPIVEILSIALE